MCQRVLGDGGDFHLFGAAATQERRSSGAIGAADSDGLLLAVNLTPADSSDSAGAMPILDHLPQVIQTPSIHPKYLNFT